MKSLAAVLLRVVLTALVVAVVAWSVAAIWIDGPKNRELAGMLCIVVAAGSLLLLLVVQPWWWSLATAVVPFVVVMAWWLSIAPSNDRDWQADVARLPSATVAGDRVTIRNVRNFAYPSAAAVVERWETRGYDLGRLEGFDMFLSYWGPKIIAHTISSWQFSDGQHLAISIETRKKNGQDYSPVLGFFRQFELYYVVADERDVIGVRTGLRQETMQLYRVRGDEEAPNDKPYYVDESRCDLVRSVPFKANSMLAFLNSAGAHGASIPADAKPTDLERYVYQFRLGPDRKGIQQLLAQMSAERRERWAGGKRRTG